MIGDLSFIFDLLKERFAAIEQNEYHLLKSLTYFEDAEAEPMPAMLKEVTWEEIRSAIVAEAGRLSP